VKDNKERARDTDSLVYQCRLPLSTTTLNYVADLIRARRTKLGTRWRKADAGR